MVDHENIDLRFGGFQFQAQFVLKCSKEIGTRFVLRRRDFDAEATELGIVRGPAQQKIEPSAEPCLIHRRTVQNGSLRANIHTLQGYKSEPRSLTIRLARAPKLLIYLVRRGGT